MFDLRIHSDFLTVLEQFLGFFQFFFQLLAWNSTILCIFLQKNISLINYLNLPLYQIRLSTLFLFKVLQIKNYSPGAVLIQCVSDCISALFPRSCVRSSVWATLNQEPKHMFSMAIQVQKKRSLELLAEALKISWLNAGKIWKHNRGYLTFMQNKPSM